MVALKPAAELAASASKLRWPRFLGGARAYGYLVAARSE